MKKVTVFWPPESLKKSRFNLQLIISFAILLFAFISCNNLINSDDNSYSQNPSGTEEYINFTGRCSLDGAYPRQLASARAQNTGMEGRSALPQIDSSYEYFVEASSADGKTSTGGVNPNLTFSIPLAINHTWTITAGIRKTGSTDKIIFSAESDPITPDRTATSFENLNLILKPCQSGSGSVSLTMTVPAAVKKIETECSDTNWKDKIETGVESSEAYIRSKSDGSNVNTVKSGIYNIIIKFFDENDFILYSIPQTVNVINYMETNLWCSGGSSDSPITEDGHFTLQSDHISKYTSTIIYVGPNSATSSTADSNEGRAYSPLESVNEAINRIRNANVSRDYTILVSKRISENIKIGGEGADVLPGTAASSITIQGLNNNAADVLMSPQLSTAPCLSIQTDIPVIFKNIKITTYSASTFGEYNTSAQGGGLYIKTGADAPGVTLDSGALIDNCIISGTESGTEPKGAGIYLDSGKLTIKTGAKISNNHFPDSNGFGGGIYIKSGAELILSGSFDIPYGDSVTQNDIYVEAAESIKIKNAISPQTGTSGLLATITPAQDLQRGVSIVSLASGSSLSSIVPYKDYFALSNDDWLLKANSAGNALVIDAPIYVAGAELHPYTGVAGKTAADGGNGTKSAPYSSIFQAINAMNVKEDYTIYVDGVLTYPQSISGDISDKANSITVKGINGLDEHGEPNDVIDADWQSNAFNISGGIPVTLESLKITKGSASDCGGIEIKDNTTVILGNDLIVTGNKATSGAGVKIESGSSLQVKGNAKVYGNNTLDGKPSNVYLADGQTIGVIGALTNGSKKAQIGISTAAEPSLTSKVTFTSGYGVYNSGVAPGTYFTGDQWTVAAGSDGEACLAASSGNITIEPVYEDITINVDKTSVLKSASEKKFTFTATGTDSEGNTNPITIGSGEGQLALTIDSVTYHGETMTSPTHYTTGANYVTLDNSLPAGNYTINTRAVYQGSLSEARTYSASFEVKIKESNIENVSSGSQAVSAISAMTESGTIKYTGALTTDEIQSMKEALNNLNTAKPDVEVTLDLSGVTGYTVIENCYKFFYENPNIVSLTFPEGITEIPAGCLRGLSKLKTLNLPSTVQTFGVEQICYLCPLLETVTLGGNPAGDNGTVKVVNNVVYSSDGKKLWFYGNKASTADLVVPDGVEEIYEWAFATSHFTKVTLPASLEKVGFGAFTELESTVTTVNYKGSESDKSSITFDDWNDAVTGIPWNCNYTGD